MQKQTFNYGKIFARFGYPLTPAQALPSDLLKKAEKRLGVRIPSALREYYLVAGKEKRFNRSFQRFLHPSKWFVVGHHLVFLEENQSVCWWGVSIKTSTARDPAVVQGVNDLKTWITEHQKCSKFLTVLLHYQAVSNGFRFCGSSAAPDNLHDRLKKGWNYVGKLNHLWAFSRQNQVVCVEPSLGLPSMPALLLPAGGKTKKDLRSIEESLSLKLQ